MNSPFGQFDEAAYEEFLSGMAERYDFAVKKEDLKCNKPQALRDNSNSSHVVRACYPGAPEGGKLIKFGMKGSKHAGPPKKGESEAMKAKRRSFKARHAKNIAKGPSSAAYWADKVKW